MYKYLFFFLLYSLKSTLLSAQTYPQTTAYISVVHPIVTVYPNETQVNFSGSYTVGFPVGVNLLKSNRFGFSFEVVPFIRSEAGVSRVNNILFHPGVIFRFPKGFNITTRMAFETTGRYGLTLVFSKVIIRTKTNNIFLGMPIPLRFGNEKPASFGAVLQVGVTF